MQSKGSIYEGRTLDDAVKKGLQALGLSRAEVMITVMEEGSSGFLGLGARPYRVRVMPRPGGAMREPSGAAGRGPVSAGGPDRGDRDRGGRRRGSERGERGERGMRADRGDRGGRGVGERGPAGAGAPGAERGPGGREPRRGGRDDRPARPAGPPDRGRERGPRREEPIEARGPDRPGGDEPRQENGGANEERGGRRRGRRGGRGRGGSRRDERGSFDAAPGLSDAPPREAAESRPDADRMEIAAPGPERMDYPREIEPRAERPEREYEPRAERPEREFEPRGERGPRPDRGPRGDRGPRERHESASATAEISSDELVALGRKVTEDLLKAMGFEGRIEARADGTSVEVTAEVADDEELLTGRKGETRQALQHLLNRMVNRGEGSRYHLQLEINDFWRRREEELEGVARALADDAAASGEERLTEYLNAQERRIVHVTLREDARVKTYAIGDGLIKKVAVAPADAADAADAVEEARPEA